MHILSILLFCFSANLDTFLIGLACSLGGSSFPVKKNLLLSSVCTAGTALAMLSGRLIGGILSYHTANLIGGILLIFLGTWFTFSGIRSVVRAKRGNTVRQKPGSCPSKETADKNTTAMTTALEVTEKEFAEEEFTEKELTDRQVPSGNTSSVLPLAIALSLNNFALGLGASITGLPVFTTSLATFGASFFLLLAGQWTGHTCLARFCGNYAGLLSGMIILILGIYEIFI